MVRGVWETKYSCTGPNVTSIPYLCYPVKVDSFIKEYQRKEVIMANGHSYKLSFNIQYLKEKADVLVQYVDLLPSCGWEFILTNQAGKYRADMFHNMGWQLGHIF